MEGCEGCCGGGGCGEGKGDEEPADGGRSLRGRHLLGLVVSSPGLVTPKGCQVTTSTHEEG